MRPTKRIHVKVTQADIDSGKWGCMRCPIALALARTFGPHEIVVGTRTVFKRGDMDAIECDDSDPWLPDSAYRFIARYDRKLPVEPFGFYLNVPVEWLS